MHRTEQEYDINLPQHNIPLLAPYLFIYLLPMITLSLNNTVGTSVWLI